MPKGMTPKERKEKITKGKINPNPDAVKSTKKLKEESDVKKLEKFSAGLAGLAPSQLDGRLKRFLKTIQEPERQTKRTLRKSFSAEGKAPVEKKKGGEVKKKSKKAGRLALRGYGKSR